MNAASPVPNNPDYLGRLAMSHTSHAGGGVYKPTSLEFINRPNPVEPQSEPHRHPLNGFHQLPQASYQEYVRSLISRGDHADSDRPFKRRKSGHGKSLDLPKLPVRPGAKRQRLPPTLSGLHQPPPDAGILPSISTDQPVQAVQQRPVDRSRPPKLTPAQPAEEPSSSTTKKQEPPTQPASAKTKRKKWSDEETADLLKGVARFGIGNWTKILKHEDYRFQSRTALDLKDRFRVCCPDDYKQKKLPQKPTKESSPAADSRSERKTREELKELGINQPFMKVDRRKRTDYSVEEDESLLRGFQKYRNAWAEIRADQTLGLNHRTPTDLRDRMRNKFPKEFASLGLTPRPGDSSKSKRHHSKTEREQSTAYNRSEAANAKSSEKAVEKPLSLSSIVAPVNADHPPLPYKPPSQSSKHSQKLFPPFHDPYFGATFDHDDSDSEPITLDRDILDWPSDLKKHYSHTIETTKGTGGIDPLATLNLPRPTAVPPLAASQTTTVGAGTLPSVAAITAGSSSEYSDDDGLQLPSLMFGPMYEGDAMRTSGPGHFLGIDELIS